MKRRDSLLLSLGCFTLSQSICLTSASAQIIPDGTTDTIVEFNGNNAEINNGDRSGSNLFHSFSDFSVSTNSSAFFNNAADIVNIFSRVTGGNISNIDGLLSANGTANLFLINPAGIIFGEGASLDIGGSFYGSTADSILFPNEEFSATDLDNSSSLTINAPIGLSFRDNTEEIVNQSIDINASDRITIDSEDLNGNFSGIFNQIDSGMSGNAGDINITANSISLNNSGQIDDITGTQGNAGSLTINATENIILRNNSSIPAATTANTNGGNIIINADFIVTLPNQNSGNDIIANPQGGNGGVININSQALFGVEEQPLNDTGAAGEIRITTTSFSVNRNNLFSDSLSPAFRIPSDTEIPMNLIESEQTFALVCLSEQSIKKPSGLIIKDEKLSSPTIAPIKTSIGDIYPARGVVKTADGKIILTSYPNNNKSIRKFDIFVSCKN